MPDNTKLLAVLIDADNVPAKYASAILEEVTSFGEPGLRRVYGDWSNVALAGWAKAAHQLGLVQHQQAANTKGKNASDIGLVIDAMDILHTGHFDGFVLVSSDSDFTRLASRIRENGLTVIGIGERKTPNALKNACNRFIAIENIYQDGEDPGQSVEIPKLSPNLSKEAEQLILSAMDKIDVEGSWYALSRIGHQLVADKPDFDTRTYGFKKLSDLVRELKGFEIKSEPGTQPQVRKIKR